jgi:hypothetical protein
VEPEAQAADAAASDGVRVIAAYVSRDVTVYGLWINWKECIEGYPDVKPLFQACEDQRFEWQKSACELDANAFVSRTGISTGIIDQVKLAQQFTCGQIVYAAGTSLHKVGVKVGRVSSACWLRSRWCMCRCNVSYVNLTS